MNQDDNGIPKIGCVNHDCDKCKAQQPEPLAYIRKDQLQKAAQSPMLCEVTPEPRQDRIGIYTSPPASKPWVDWIDPNDKTQKQYLPHIGEPVLFCHGGKTYCGHHNGGSFQNKDEYFNTWECRWMYLPSAHGITGEQK